MNLDGDMYVEYVSVTYPDVFNQGYKSIIRIPTVKLKISGKAFFKSEFWTSKNYNLNVTEVRDSGFKNDFSGIFNFTVGILSHIDMSADTLDQILNCTINCENNSTCVDQCDEPFICESAKSQYNFIYTVFQVTSTVVGVCFEPILQKFGFLVTRKRFENLRIKDENSFWKTHPKFFPKFKFSGALPTDFWKTRPFKFHD